MAIGRISGAMLYENLERQGVDLRFEGNLIYLDVNNNQNSQDGRVGIKTNSPAYDLDVNGEARVGDVLISGSSISSLSGLLDLGAVTDITISGGTSNYVLTTDGNGTLRWSDIGSLAQATGTTGMTVILGTPTDSSLNEHASWDSWTPDVYVTDAIDDLNQVALNIAKGTYVGEANFSANVVAGPSPMTVEFTSTVTGNPTNYYWDFGDGTVITAGSVVSHTYNNEEGEQYTVTLRAYNSAGTLNGDLSAGARGSVDQEIKTDYITLYTPNPVPSLSLISDVIDTDDVTGLAITNFSEYSNSYEIVWGDGTTTALTKLNGGIQVDGSGKIVYDPNTKGAVWEDDGSGTDTRTHIYSNTNGDTKYDLVLLATSDTAGPSPVTIESDPYPIYVYSEHTPSFTANTVRVVNEEATAGGVVSFTNSTDTAPGNTSIFLSNRYRWIWDDSTDNTIDVGPGIAGNPGSPISHTFALSASDQAAGVTKTYSVTLDVVNGHSLSPFTSLPTVITVEPDVRSNFTLTADIVSDRLGDSSSVGYAYTDYNNNDRSKFNFSTTSQNADTYEWSWGDGNTSGTINEGDAGTATGGSISHSYTTTGTKTVTLAVAGMPGTIAQTDTESRTLTIAANPVAPGNLSSKTLSMSTSSQGTSPRLAYDATNNSGGAMPSAGTTVTRYVSGTISSSTITDANTSIAGTLVASVNGTDDGSVIFDTASNKSGTYNSLVVVDDRDAHLAISDSVYPTGFYKVFDARISKFISDLPVGYSTLQLTHTVSGNTNSTGFVRDDLIAVPTLDTSSATITEKTSGTYRYISGVPYYNTGGAVTISGVTITDWIGQTYFNGNPVTVSDGANLESTTGSLISPQSKSYTDVDGSTSFLTSGIPNANTGNGSIYALGGIDVNIDGTAASVGYLNVTATNVNGSGTTKQVTVPINVYSSTISGINEESIPVSSNLGGTYSDNGKRVVISNTGGPLDATPAFNSATNYYTTQVFTGATTVDGTNEAVVRWGAIKNVTTDFTNYLPAGPDLATGRTGYQYFTFAFRRTLVANFDIAINGKISGLWIAAPGTDVDTTSTLNGWLDSSTNYAGSGVPGANTATGGNGSNGCAVTSSDRIPTGTAINGSYTLTLGGENLSKATGNVCLVRIQLATNDYVNSISIGASA
jgi:PKD repeat protein